jgi:PAS domain S-box-containing protein
MSPPSWGGMGGHTKPLEVLWADGERLFCRTWRGDPRQPVLAVLPAAEHPTPESLDRLANEYGLKDHLDSTWAARPVELIREHGRTMLLLECPAVEPLDHLIGPPMEVGKFLRLAVALSATLCRLHEAGLMHKDMKPANVLVNVEASQTWLTGFGIASRAPREQQSPEPPEVIPGTLAYMAPEQTGRMSRSIDSRSDLYSMGMTLYQMLTGTLPFTASDPMEWVHCHIARVPPPPTERSRGVPATVSAIILKLLAKTPEERYQTAAGVERDLRRCLAEWEALRRVGDFAPGEHDTPDRLLIPERLYGRAREMGILIAAFERVAASGNPELVLVSGYPGSGKSSVVNELTKVLVTRRCLFAGGKLDQYKRDIPYAPLAQAFQSLVRLLLSRSQAELREWRDALQNALDPNGLLLLDLVPVLELVIGEQTPVPELPLHDAQRRFHLLLRRFIAVFARPDQPLVLFLDDLQWIDVATMEFLEDLFSHPDVRHLLLIGAYRDKEVSAVHPLMRKLESIRKSGATVHSVVLAPFTAKDLQQMIADSLHCEPERVSSLAQRVREKTGGNPFFAIQFLTTLAEDGLLTLDRHHERWSWDLRRIDGMRYTDNVADLMVSKLQRMPLETRNALQQLACLGSSAELTLLHMVSPDTMEEMHEQLWEAVRTGLVIRGEGSYRFLHDRVQEAAYALIPEELRAGTHLRIGRRLAAETPPDERDERIFEIVNHLNRASDLITSNEERQRTAKLNLIAARRAKSSTAYASALNYLSPARALLTDASWEHSYELIFSIEYLTAECELLTAELDAAEKRLAMLAERARTAHDIAVVTRLRLTLYTALDRSDRGVEVCLEYLRRGGTDWPAHPTGDEVRREYEQIWLQLGSRPIEELLDLPWMTNPDVLDTLEVLTEIVTPAVFFDQNLCSLVICRMVNLSLEHGNSDGSCFAYVWFGIITGPRFGNHKDGFRFGRLGYQLVESRGLKRYQARTYMSFGSLVLPWVKHALQGRDLVRRAFDTAHRVGDFTFAAYSLQQLFTNLLFVGDRLSEVQAEVESGLAFARRGRFGLVVDLIASQLQLVRTLRGLTRKFGYFDDEQFDETAFEQHLASNPVLADAEFGYWALKTQARFLAGDYASAVHASLQGQPLLWSAPSVLEPSGYQFYSALSHAAFWDSALPDQKPKHLDALRTHYRQIEMVAEHCPANFADRAALVGAELARIEGRTLDALHLYEQAIHLARDNGFVHGEGIGNEVAGRFYLSQGLETNAYAHLGNAVACFASWGARGKVIQLTSSYPRLASPDARHATAMPGPSLQQLDVATVVKASQAVSSEIVLPRLVEQLMTITLQNAGADRGLLLLPRAQEYRAEAEALMNGDKVLLQHGPTINPAMPESIVRYVVRTREKVLLEDAVKPNTFSGDEYLSARKPRSLLCLPLVRQGVLGGVLYLENTLTSHAFTPARTVLLELLASQASISLENTRLYGDLREREAKVRRLVDANIIGIFIWDLQGRIVDANEAFLRIIGYSREDLVSGHMSWSELTPPEWRDADEQRVAEVKETGTVQPYEKEYRHKNGNRVPVLVGGASFEGERDEGVAFVLDLTDRKRAEQAAFENERRYREVEVALAHANRVATLGQLSASIAHEVKQPVAAAVTNAQAASRWLGAQPPDIGEAMQAISRIIRNGNRASEVISRIRALVKKAPQKEEWLEVNEAIREVIALTHGEVIKNGVSVEMQLAQALPLVRGDRVQLQQVVLNLVINSVEAMSRMVLGSRELLISTAVTGSDVLVTVRDSGPGFACASIGRVFEAFYTTKPGGLGLGLSICNSIIQAHGGRLWASVAGAGGATLQFTLPAPPDSTRVSEPRASGSRA